MIGGGYPIGTLLRGSFLVLQGVIILHWGLEELGPYLSSNKERADLVLTAKPV